MKKILHLVNSSFIRSATLGIICLITASLSSQNTSDAVYQPANNNTALFYKELAGTSPVTSFNLGDPIYVQFLFTDKVDGQIQSGEHVRAAVYVNDQLVCKQNFKSDDALLPVYFAETYSLDLNVMVNAVAFTEIKALTESSMTDRKMSTFMYLTEGLFNKMIIVTNGKLGEGNHKIKVALETGADELDPATQQTVFKARKTFSSGEFTLNITKPLIESYRQELQKTFGGTVADGFKTVPDNGVKTDTHKQNTGKIIFSSSPITEQTTTGFKSSFASLTEGIYGRVYLPASLHNLMANPGLANNVTSFTIGYYLDGKLINGSVNNISQDMANKFTSFEIIPAPKEGVDYLGIENQFGYNPIQMVKDFAETLKKTTAGKHKIKLTLSVSYLDPYDVDLWEDITMATGEFEITIVEAERKAFVEKNAQKYGETQHKSYKEGCANLYVKNSTGRDIQYSVGSYKGTLGYLVTMDFLDIPLGTSYTIDGRSRIVTTADDGNTLTIQ